MQTFIEFAIGKNTQNYYHGTSSEERALQIIENGIRPQETGRKDLLAPVFGRVYVTPRLNYALIYAFGVNMLSDTGEEPNERLKKTFRKDGRYGYIFRIPFKNLEADVQPDEDQIGQLLYYVLNDRIIPPEFADPHEEFFVKAYGNNYIKKRMLDFSKRLTDKQIEGIRDGDYRYWASGGKKMLNYMSEDFKKLLVSLGSHVAHGGSIWPDKAWKIDKHDINRIGEFGQNFSKYARPIDI